MLSHVARMPKEEPHLIPWRKVLPAPALRNEVDACCGICCEDNLSRAACIYKRCYLSPGILIPSRGLHNGKNIGPARCGQHHCKVQNPLALMALLSAQVRALQRIEAPVEAGEMN